jgi:hypothetical protein
MRQQVKGNIFARGKSEIPDGEKELLAAATRKARNKLANTVVMLSQAINRYSSYDGMNSELRESLELYFLLHTEKNVNDRLKRMVEIDKKLRKIQQGLAGRIELENISRKHWIKNRKYYENHCKKRNFTRLQQAKGKAPLLGVLGYVTFSMLTKPSNIHLAFAFLFDEEASAHTIVHEASHKFAETKDHAYWNTTAKRFKKKLTCKKAIDNADSYAGFAMDFDPAMMRIPPRVPSRRGRASISSLKGRR